MSSLTWRSFCETPEGNIQNNEQFDLKFSLQPSRGQYSDSWFRFSLLTGSAERDHCYQGLCVCVSVRLDEGILFCLLTGSAERNHLITWDSESSGSSNSNWNSNFGVNVKTIFSIFVLYWYIHISLYEDILCETYCIFKICIFFYLNSCYSKIMPRWCASVLEWHIDFCYIYCLYIVIMTYILQSIGLNWLFWNNVIFSFYILI